MNTQGCYISAMISSKYVARIDTSAHVMRSTSEPLLGQDA